MSEDTIKRGATSLVMEDYVLVRGERDAVKTTWLLSLAFGGWLPFRCTTQSPEPEAQQVDEAKKAAGQFIRGLEADVWQQYVDAEPAAFWGKYRARGARTAGAAVGVFVEEHSDELQQSIRTNHDKLKASEISTILTARLRRYLSESAQ